MSSVRVVHVSGDGSLVSWSGSSQEEARRRLFSPSASSQPRSSLAERLLQQLAEENEGSIFGSVTGSVTGSVCGNIPGGVPLRRDSEVSLTSEVDHERSFLAVIGDSAGRLHGRSPSLLEPQCFKEPYGVGHRGHSSTHFKDHLSPLRLEIPTNSNCPRSSTPDPSSTISPTKYTNFLEGLEIAPVEVEMSGRRGMGHGITNRFSASPSHEKDDSARHSAALSGHRNEKPLQSQNSLWNRLVQLKKAQNAREKTTPHGNTSEKSQQRPGSSNSQYPEEVTQRNDSPGPQQVEGLAGSSLFDISDNEVMTSGPDMGCLPPPHKELSYSPITFSQLSTFAGCPATVNQNDIDNDTDTDTELDGYIESRMEEMIQNSDDKKAEIKCLVEQSGLLVTQKEDFVAQEVGSATQQKEVCESEAHIAEEKSEPPAKKIKPTFMAPLKQSRVTAYYKSTANTEVSGQCKQTLAVSPKDNIHDTLSKLSNKDAIICNKNREIYDSKADTKHVSKVKEPVKTKQAPLTSDSNYDKVCVKSRSTQPQCDLVLTNNTSTQFLDLLRHCHELAMVIVFSEGFTQLRDSRCLEGFGCPRSVVVRLVREKEQEDREAVVTTVLVNLWAKSTSAETKKLFWSEVLLHATARKLVYDAKAFLKCVVTAYPEQLTQVEEVVLLDPLVGVWLLQPDKPQYSFPGCLQALGLAHKTPGATSAFVGVREKAEETTAPCGVTSPVLGSLNTVVQDTALLSLLAKQLFSRLRSLHLWPVFYQLEMQVLPHLVVMERQGVSVDQAKLQVLGRCLSRQLSHLEKEAHLAAGDSFNLCSPGQVRAVLFDRLQLDIKAGLTVAKTAGGVKSTSESVLQSLVTSHPLPAVILQHRHVAKLRSTYVEGLGQHCAAEKQATTQAGHGCLGGRVYCSWDQLAAATGRITSVAPNLQGVPKADVEVAGDKVSLRSAITSSPGTVLLCADFEQIELRVYAALSLDPSLVAATEEKGDMFRNLAASWLSKELQQVTEDDREKTKRLVYALMYGAGLSRLAAILGVPLAQVRAVTDSFYARFSSLRAFDRRVLAMAARDGHLTSILGRRRYFPGIRSQNPAVKAQAQRAAFNFLLQGSAADLAKLGLIEAQRRLRIEAIEAVLVLMIHDELVWEVRTEQAERAAAVVRGALQHITDSPLLTCLSNFQVTLPVKVSIGDTLGSLQLVPPTP